MMSANLRFFGPLRQSIFTEAFKHSVTKVLTPLPLLAWRHLRTPPRNTLHHYSTKIFQTTKNITTLVSLVLTSSGGTEAPSGINLSHGITKEKKSCSINSKSFSSCWKSFFSCCCCDCALLKITWKWSSRISNWHSSSSISSGIGGRLEELDLGFNIEIVQLSYIKFD